jgi:uncharacterized cupredoxin-like copper-binding protein
VQDRRINNAVNWLTIEESMNPILQKIAAVIVVVGTAAAPAFAAENETNIKVALLDMTSLMPTGYMGYGMMGPGQNLPGPGAMGPGMMGPGMMGGYGMMGMMGPGMMGGMMSMRLNQPSVKAGKVTFEVTNWSRSVLHEMIIVSVDNPSAPLPYDYAQARIPEEQVKVLGEAGDLQPNTSTTVELTLSAGSYLLICNLPGHYAAGMVTALNVTP